MIRARYFVASDCSCVLRNDQHNCNTTFYSPSHACTRREFPDEESLWVRRLGRSYLEAHQKFIPVKAFDTANRAWATVSPKHTLHGCIAASTFGTKLQARLHNAGCILKHNGNAMSLRFYFVAMWVPAHRRLSHAAAAFIGDIPASQLPPYLITMLAEEYVYGTVRAVRRRVCLGIAIFPIASPDWLSMSNQIMKANRTECGKRHLDMAAFT